MRWFAFPRWAACGVLASTLAFCPLAQAENPCGGFDYRGPLPERSPWTVVLPCQMEMDASATPASAPVYQGCDVAPGGEEPLAGPAGDPWLERHYRPYAPQVEPVRRFDLEQAARDWQLRRAEKSALEINLGHVVNDHRHSYGCIVAELVNEESEGLSGAVAPLPSAVASTYQPRSALHVSLHNDGETFEVCPLARWRCEEIVEVCPCRPEETVAPCEPPATDACDDAANWEWSDECWGEECYDAVTQPAAPSSSAPDAAGSEFDGSTAEEPLEVCNPWTPPAIIVEEIAAHRPLMSPRPLDLEKYWRTQPLLVPEVIREDLEEETEAAASPNSGWSLREAILWLRVTAQSARESARLFDGMSRTLNALADELPDVAQGTAEPADRAARRRNLETR